MAHSVGKVVVTNAVAMDEDDVRPLRPIREKCGTTFDVRKVLQTAQENTDNA